MATLPVESMKTGGALWFTDLTLPDPFYMLPIASCVSFIATIEVNNYQYAIIVVIIIISIIVVVVIVVV